MATISPELMGGAAWFSGVDWGKGTATVDDFAEFVGAAMPGLLRYGHALTGNPHDAADLVQGVLE